MPATTKKTAGRSVSNADTANVATAVLACRGVSGGSSEYHDQYRILQISGMGKTMGRPVGDAYRLAPLLSDEQRTLLAKYSKASDHTTQCGFSPTLSRQLMRFNELVKARRVRFSSKVPYLPWHPVMTSWPPVVTSWLSE